MTEQSTRTRWRRRRRRWAVLAVVLVTLYLTRGWTLPAWGRWLDVSEPPRPAEYALVLGGGSNTRPFVAAGLYKKGLVGKVLVPQVGLAADARDGISPGDSELIRRVLVARGVPPDRIVPLAGEVNSTFDEAEALARFIEGQPEAVVAVVTNDLHTRRARRIFRRVLGPRGGQVYFVAAPTDQVSADTWWKTERGFSIYMSETFKCVYYEVRY